MMASSVKASKYSNQVVQRAKVNQNSWKLALTREITNLEDNLSQLYQIINLKYHRIVTNDTDEEIALLDNQQVLSKKDLDGYEKIIEEYVCEIDQAATTLCLLLNSGADFDLPVPVVILLKLAAKVGSLRWHNFGKKIPGTLAKRHIYNKTSFRLIQMSVTMFRWISSALATDILPFQPIVNEFNLNLLEWTRTSNLEKHDCQQYCWLRSLIFNGISWDLARFSLNVNFGPEQLDTLIGVELLESVADGLASSTHPTDQYQNSLQDKNICDALDCLDWLFICYAKYLEAKLEFKLKSCIAHTCVDMYRNFDKTTVSPLCRRHLLRILATIANQPCASSTTELAWHIFEQAVRMENDLEIVLLARKAMDLGLAHRPLIVPSHDYYALKLTNGHTFETPRVRVAAEKEDETELQETSTRDLEPEASREPKQNGFGPVVKRSKVDLGQEISFVADPPPVSISERVPEPSNDPDLEPDLQQEPNKELASTSELEPEAELEPMQDPILSLFVNKPAD